VLDVGFEFGCRSRLGFGYKAKLLVKGSAGPTLPSIVSLFLPTIQGKVRRYAA